MTNAPGAFVLGKHRALDGLRGVAILLVLLEHGDVVRRAFGFIGVNTFFVLSGFLITCLLVSEWDKTGGINLGYFYLRRVLRLFPALLVMLLLFCVYVILTESGSALWHHLKECLWALFYVTNWVRALHLGDTSYLGHTWSLSIEEQFYLIWPWLLRYALRKTTRDSLLCWLLLALAASLTTRIFLQWAGPLVPFNSATRLTDGLDTRADSLLVGCISALLFSSNRLEKLRAAILQYGISLWAGLGLLILCFTKHLAPWMIYGGWFLASLLAAVIILQLVDRTDTVMHRWLGNPALVYIGKISYGLYIWHFPILAAMQDHHLPWQNLGYLIPSFVVAIGSYYFIERPFLELKSRYQRAP